MSISFEIKLSVNVGMVVGWGDVVELDTYYLRRKFPRRHSVAAEWSPRLAKSALVIFIFALLTHRFDVVGLPMAVLLILTALMLALLAICFSMRGIYTLWMYGYKGGGAALYGAALALIVVFPVVFVLAYAMPMPKLYDVSTDVETPAQFRSAQNLSTMPAGNPENNLMNYYATLLLNKSGLAGLITDNRLRSHQYRNGLQQLAAYPEVVGHLYDGSPDHVLRGVNTVLNNMGWTVVAHHGVAGEDQELTVEALAKTTYLGIKSDVVIRLRDEDEHTLVDMRSVSHFGSYDLGMNADFIMQFFNELDLEMGNAVPETTAQP